VNNQDDTSDLSKSLLRRRLKPEQEPHAPDDELPSHEQGQMLPDTIVSPVPGQPSTDDSVPPVSPIRPVVHDDIQPQPPLTPSVPEAKPAQGLTPREQMQRAEEALINLREKMAQVATEFAQGTLNRAQFDAIYARYSEQRDITERLLARNPESQAWQSVIQPGHTTFLISHYEARTISYAIYDQVTFELINITGSVQLEKAQIEAVLKRLQTIMHERGNPGPAQKKIGSERCVLFVPGTTTTAAVIFSREPSRAQINRVEDIHRDFERANEYALRNRDYTVEQLVFPHRALFEEKKY
jgi:hypothetical protein